MVDRRIYQLDLIDSFALWIVLGLQPGSFSTACMFQDVETAYRAAHPMLKRPHSIQDIVANMLHFVETNFPRTLLDDKDLMRGWHTHQGLLEADHTIKTQLRLECGREPWFMQYVNEDAIDYAWGVKDAKPWKSGDGTWLAVPRKRTFA
jgi:hypothetical protein